MLRDCNCTTVTNGWPGYDNVSHMSLMNNGIYQHEVIIYAEHFVDDINPEINTQAIEGLWMQSKRKLRYQSDTSRALFSSYWFTRSALSDPYYQSMCLSVCRSGVLARSPTSG